MRARGFVALLAVGLLAGCAGSGQATAAGSWAAGSPTPRPVQTPTSSPTPSVAASPLDLLPLPSSQPQNLTCERIPRDKLSYWQEYADPPATCQQAHAVLPTAVVATLRTGNATVNGWSCRFSVETANARPYYEVTCTKGGLTVYADALSAP
jgi:hypothetical protein